ncbi:glycosyltransferase family 4 protein [Yinghuangia aomiensis]
MAERRPTLRRPPCALLTRDRPVLIVQSLPAIVPPEGVRYAVYTDRVGLEGTTGADDVPGGTGAYRSRYTDGWLDRERRMLAGAHRVFVMGPSTAEVLAARYDLDPERIVVVGAGVNVPAPPAAPPARTLDGPPRLLFVGTQWELKGGPTLLAAFARLHADDPRWTLTLAGSAPAGPLPPGVTAAGRVPHERMPELYDAADVLVIPTHREACGIALVEALTRGLPAWAPRSATSARSWRTRVSSCRRATPTPCTPHSAASARTTPPCASARPNAATCSDRR